MCIVASSSDRFLKYGTFTLKQFAADFQFDVYKMPSKSIGGFGAYKNNELMSLVINLFEAERCINNLWPLHEFTHSTEKEKH